MGVTGRSEPPQLTLVNGKLKYSQDEYRPSSVFTISTCSHQFCRTCMSTYVVSKINSNMVGPRGMVCPDPYCKEEERSLTEDDMRLVLSTQSWRFRQYLKLRNRYLIDSDPNMKWCNEVRRREKEGDAETLIPNTALFRSVDAVL